MIEIYIALCYADSRIMGGLIYFPQIIFLFQIPLLPEMNYIIDGIACCYSPPIISVSHKVRFGLILDEKRKRNLQLKNDRGKIKNN